MIDEVTIGGETVPQYGSGNSEAQLGWGEQTMTLEFTAPPTVDDLMNIKLNKNTSGSQFIIVGEEALNVSIAGNTATVTYWGNGTIVRSWDYVNQFQPRNGMPRMEAFALTQTDDMREALLATPGNEVFIVNQQDINPYKYLNWEDNVNNLLASQEGLAVKTIIS